MGAWPEGFCGVGLGIDVHNQQPDWRALLRDAALEVDFLEVYTRGDVAGAHAVREAAGDLPLLYHDDALDPILPEGLRETDLRLAVENLEATGAPWCVSELATRRLGERYLDFFMPILLTEDAARIAAANLRRLDDALPGRIVCENPPYQLPAGGMHVLELMARVTELAEIPCVLDLGHLHSFQLCRGLEPLDQLELLPLERVIELHVAGAVIEQRRGVPIYQDAHGGAELPEVLLTMLAEVAPRCPNLGAITIEVEDADAARVARQLTQTRAAVADLLAARPGSGRPLPPARPAAPIEVDAGPTAASMELVDQVMRRPAALDEASPGAAAIDPARAAAVHESFAALVVARWWQARFPAALATLDHVLGGAEATASFLVGAPAFLSAVEEDLTGAAFVGAALDALDSGGLAAPPWFLELVGYEYLLGTGLPRRAREEPVDAALEARLLPEARWLEGGRLLQRVLVAPWQWPVGALQEEPHDAEPAPYVSLFRLEGSDAVEVEAPDLAGDLLDLLAADADPQSFGEALGPEAPELTAWLEELGFL